MHDSPGPPNVKAYVHRDVKFTEGSRPSFDRFSAGFCYAMLCLGLRMAYAIVLCLSGCLSVRHVHVFC